MDGGGDAEVIAGIHELGQVYFMDGGGSDHRPGRRELAVHPRTLSGQRARRAPVHDDIGDLDAAFSLALAAQHIVVAGDLSAAFDCGSVDSSRSKGARHDRGEAPLQGDDHDDDAEWQQRLRNNHARRGTRTKG